MDSTPSIASLLAALEAISRARSDRVLRLSGALPALPGPAGGQEEPFELLIFRGFSSSTTHPTAFDPDQPALPEGSRIDRIDLLEGPLRPQRERILATAADPRHFLQAAAWD
jgi:hypothetical protein